MTGDADRDHLLPEKSTLEGMIADTPADDVLELASLRARLSVVERRLAGLSTARLEPTAKRRPAMKDD